MLEVIGLLAGYGAVQAVRDVTFHVGAGEVLAVLGPNGAGKSTLANTVAGLHRAAAGRMLLDGTDLTGSRSTVVVRNGLALVPQGRRVFGSCTVAEHVALAGLGGRKDRVPLDDVLDHFPRLRDRWNVRARQLSGGEQQMLALTRAVLLGPKVLVLDEPTEGLAPTIVSGVASLVRQLRELGTGILLMEQPGPFPDGVADRVATMERGQLSTAVASSDERRPAAAGGEGGGS